MHGLKLSCYGLVFHPTSRYPVYVQLFLYVLATLHLQLAPVCTPLAEIASRCFLTPLCVTVCASQADLHARTANLIPTSTENARFWRSLEHICEREQTSCWFFCGRIELIEAVWWRGVTASGVQQSSDVVRRLQSTVVAVKRSWTVDAELTRHPVVSVASPSLVATSRSTTPSSSFPVPSHVHATRMHRRRGRVDDRALTPGSTASRCWRTDVSFWRFCATFHVAAYVLCLICCQLPLFFLFSWPATRWGLTL